MQKSESIANLAAALAKAQAEMPIVKKNVQNKFTKNWYADLGALISTATPILTKHGLSVSQFPISAEGRVGVRTILMHETGEYLEDAILIVPDTAAKGLTINQSSGVTITYLRRYQYAAIVGLVADEDTDGDTRFSDTNENSDAQDKVKGLMVERTWNKDLTEAISVMTLDATGQGLTYDEASEILNYSVLPADVPVKTLQSWFKHYMKSEGGNMALKAADANEAYAKAKKTGGK